MSIYRNSDGELQSESDYYQINQTWIPFRSTKPYADELTPERAVSPYSNKYTPVRTVKGFDTIRILPGGGNQPSMPEQIGAFIGFSGVDANAAWTKDQVSTRYHVPALELPLPQSGGCSSCGSKPSPLMMAGAALVALYFLRKVL